MEPFQLVTCNQEDNEYIFQKLLEFNMSQVPSNQEKNFENLSHKLVTDDGRIIAGILGKIYGWNIAHIDILWVDSEYKNQGFGSFLLGEIEKIAQNRGCHLIHLDTFDFQAKDFYLKQGYEIFGTLKDCPKGHVRYYLSKNI